MFNDLPALTRYNTAALPLLPFIDSTHLIAVVHFTRAMELAARARSVPPYERDDVLAELAGHRDWLAARAEDAPFNFGYLVDLVDAERLWAAGDPWAASERFDVALRAAAENRRPLHLALITERAARFHLATRRRARRPDPARTGGRPVGRLGRQRQGRRARAGAPRPGADPP